MGFASRPDRFGLGPCSASSAPRRAAEAIVAGSGDDGCLRGKLTNAMLRVRGGQ